MRFRHLSQIGQPPGDDPDQRGRVAVERKQRDQDAQLALRVAAAAVWDAYLDHGPVDDGTPRGEAFAAALDRLMTAAVAAGAKFRRRKASRRKHREEDDDA